MIDRCTASRDCRPGRTAEAFVRCAILSRGFGNLVNGRGESGALTERGLKAVEASSSPQGPFVVCCPSAWEAKTKTRMNRRGRTNPNSKLLQRGESYSL